jgi:hypothetical protein
MQEDGTNSEDSDQEDDKDHFFDELEVVERQVVLRERTSLHGPLIIPRNNLNMKRSGCESLPYGSLMFQNGISVCMCNAFINRNFEYNNKCCAVEGGQFWEYLKEERRIATEEGVLNFHYDRDPNDCYRIAMYRHFITTLVVTGARKEIPLCYVTAIREIWPEASGSYVGFKFKIR